MDIGKDVIDVCHSLNAIMLGRLRMRVDQCLVNYPTMASNIFSNPRKQLKGWPKAKYDSTPLEDEIKKIVRSRIGENPKEEMMDFKSPDDLCRT